MSGETKSQPSDLIDWVICDGSLVSVIHSVSFRFMSVGGGGGGLERRPPKPPSEKGLFNVLCGRLPRYPNRRSPHWPIRFLFSQVLNSPPASQCSYQLGPGVSFQGTQVRLSFRFSNHFSYPGLSGWNTKTSRSLKTTAPLRNQASGLSSLRTCRLLGLRGLSGSHLLGCQGG